MKLLGFKLYKFHQPGDIAWDDSNKDLKEHHFNQMTKVCSSISGPLRHH